jgi:hypothetical protein
VSASRGGRAWSTARPGRLRMLPRELAALPARLRALPGWLAALARRLPSLAREHWLLTLLLAAGLALRAVTQLAYQPALYYIDSVKYLFGAYPGNDPPGYQILIRPAVDLSAPWLIPAVQHVLGLVMAVVLYAVLRRRGVPRWLSALAVAPILLDAYQLQIEQNVMPDVMFEACIVAGLAALLWHPRPRTALIITGGLALGASATARQVGEIFLLPALAYLLVALPGWRHRLTQCAILCAAFALPILAASYRNYVVIHQFSLAPYSSGSIYGRMAAAADCATLKMPSYERALCPTPQQQRNGADWLDHQFGSPIKSFQAPMGMSNGHVVSNFSRRVLIQQPTRVVAAIGKDALELYALDRVTGPGDTSINRWQFQPYYQQFPPYLTIRDGVVRFTSFTPQGAPRYVWTTQGLGGSPTVVRPLASFLHAYQVDGGYTPGPLLLLATLAGLAGTLTLTRRRATPTQRLAAQACLLTFTTGAAVLLISDAFEFSWRYQLPALITLPPAAALGLTALFLHRRPTAGAREPGTAPAPGSQAQPAAGPAGTPVAGGDGGQDNGHGQERPQTVTARPPADTG